MGWNDPQDGGERPRARAWAAVLAAAGRRSGLTLPDGFAAVADRYRRLLAQWIAAELAPGRLVPWLPVAFGCGIVLYFTAEREPTWWAASGLALVTAGIAFAARRRPFVFPLALGLAAVTLGFAVVTLHTARMAHPVLAFATSRAQVSGFVEVREERERSGRIVVRVKHIDVGRRNTAPKRVRVAVRKGTAPMVGSFVAFKAHLAPPLQPLRPGGYNFARDLYFMGIGASGYVLGKIKTLSPPARKGARLRYAAFIDRIRETIDARIRAVAPGDAGSIASALITGKRDAISAPVNNAMYVSSLAHVLSISGYHMAIVAGIAFFFLRAGLALIPSLAIRRPIKKWAAAGALAAAAFYLLLSGAEVATQRSFIMIAIVLIGVIIDRQAVTFRTLAVAAFAVLLFAPQSVVQPSFQMSFAATLALIAAYRYGLPWRANADSSFAARVALWGGREIVGLIAASFIAGLATTPYAAYHFHRVAYYGALANLLAIPVISAWSMPMGVLGVLSMPFGFDAIFWQFMVHGIDWMIEVALWVSQLPGAVGHVPAFGTGPLLLATTGLLILCLLRTPLRWCGAGLALGACLWALATPRPAVLVAADGRAAALRGPDGRLHLLHMGRDTFAVKEWLAADGDGRDIKNASLHEGVRCDAIGCIGRLSDGRLVSFVLSEEAFAEDCARAAVVVSPRAAQSGCAATLIDRKVSRQKGAIALRRNGDHFEEIVAHPPGLDRPWAPALRHKAERRQVSPATRDATPRVEDLEAGD
jgi:competence protein ComEC